MVNIASNAHYIFALLALIALATVVRQHRAGSSGRLLSHDALFFKVTRIGVYDVRYRVARKMYSKEKN